MSQKIPGILQIFQIKYKIYSFILILTCLYNIILDGGTMVHISSKDMKETLLDESRGQPFSGQDFFYKFTVCVWCESVPSYK